MKNIYNMRFYLLALVLFATSCSDFLSETPDNRLRLDSYDKIAELVANAYPGASPIFVETMSDNVGPDPANSEDRDITMAYKWQEVTSIGQDTPTYYWTACYLAIAHANQALVALDELPVTNIDRCNAIRGEALACRAYAHFMLVNIFAKHYNESTAATDLGIVFMTDPETTLLAQYERNTVGETYQLIEADIQEALKLVSNIYYKNSGKYHFTREALYGLASRFYLYKGDWENCVKYSTELLGGGYNAAYVRDNKTVLKGPSPEPIARQYTAPKEKSNLLLIRQEVGVAYWAAVGYRLVLDIIDEIELSDDDLRFKTLYGYSGRKSRFIPKFERELMRKLSVTSSSGFPYNAAVVLKGEEVVLNRIEAYIKLNQLDAAESNFNSYILSVYDNAINFATLQQFYAGNYPDLSPQDLMIKMVLDERRREFIEENLRWFDIKRYGLTVTHVDTRGQTDVLTADDFRKVVQIPQSAIEVGGLKPNPVKVDADTSQAKVCVNNDLTN